MRPEKEAANKLIAGGCKLISQHADSLALRPPASRPAS